MTRLARVSALLLAVHALAFAAHAQSAPAAADAENSRSAIQAAPAPEPAPTAAPKLKRDRPISDNLASALSASMPKYNPPPPPRTEDEDVDLREVDKPRNTIIRLPKYTVTGPRPPVFRERDIYNRSNRTNLSLARNPGLNLGNVLGLNRPIAMAMYAEQERLNNMAEMDDTAESIGRADAAAGAYLKRVTDETFMRTSDFGYTRRE